METIIFDGKAFAAKREQELKIQIDSLRTKGKSFHVKTFTFIEDEGSKIYTKLKQQSANRIGILYEPVEFSLTDDLGYIMQTIREASFDSHTSGIMVQKPTKESFEKIRAHIANQNGRNEPFDQWWDNITQAIDPQKDVDCLTTRNLDALSGELLPATVTACLHILDEAKKSLQLSEDEWKQKKVLVIGRSDIVGKPLTTVLRRQKFVVKNVGRSELADPAFRISDFDIVISATGVSNLVTGEKIKEGSVIIDVGSPHGDVEQVSVESKAAFLTPVPGGVGPVTVVSLMENIVRLTSK